MSAFDAAVFNEKIMKGLFVKIYPVIAEQHLSRCGIRSGLALDLGGGPGMLAVRLAQASQLKVIVVDPDAQCVELAADNIAEHGLSDRVTAQLGQAEHLDFADDSVDLVISRGSIYFWNDQAAGLREVFRVLRPGGWAFVGGGFGTAALRDEILAAKADDEEWNAGRRQRNQDFPPAHFEALLTELGLPGAVEVADGGTWIVITKPGRP